MPTLKLRGEKSNLYWTHNVLRFAERIPGAETEIVIAHDGLDEVV